MRRFDVKYIRAFGPAIASFIAFILFDLVILFLSSMNSVVFDDLHFIPIFLPQFFTFTVFSIISIYKAAGVHSEKIKFEKDNERLFKEKELAEITSDIEYLTGLKTRVESELSRFP